MVSNVADILKSEENLKSENKKEDIAERVLALTKKFPLYE